jgi:hypothetical protein
MPCVVLVSTKPLGIGPRGLTKLVQEFRVKAKQFQSSKLKIKLLQWFNVQKWCFSVKGYSYELKQRRTNILSP